ncbi:MAG: glutathione S-transferase family protein [Parvularculaceae bacterium]
MQRNYTLVIGDKNLSSWSLRPWIAMKQAGIEFDEVKILLDRPDTAAEIRKYSPSGLVPCLLDGDLAVNDSLAIVEYLADRHPDKALWPEDIETRARARSVAAEMHSGFASLRAHWPMAFAETRALSPTEAVARDVARIDEIWSDCRAKAGGGDFLFGAFTIADAMYAPVVSRFLTYSAQGLSEASRAYMEAMQSLPAWREWGEGAAAELR